MKRATLLFNDETDLRQFAKVVSCTSLEMNVDRLTLTCNCEDSELELAEHAYNASVIKIEERFTFLN